MLQEGHEGSCLQTPVDAVFFMTHSGAHAWNVGNIYPYHFVSCKVIAPPVFTPSDKAVLNPTTKLQQYGVCVREFAKVEVKLGAC